MPNVVVFNVPNSLNTRVALLHPTLMMTSSWKDSSITTTCMESFTLHMPSYLQYDWKVPTRHV